MKIHVKAKPKVKKEHVEKIGETSYVVHVKEPPTDGKANRAIIKALAAYLKIAPSRIRMISGFTSRQKTLDILRDEAHEGR
jgi:uncharacterized protein